MKITTTNCLYAVLTYLFTIISAQAQTWSGSISTDWDNNANWVGGVKPTTSSDVIINSGGNQPVILSGTTAVARSIQINSGASLSIQATASLSLNGSSGFSGAFSNAGTFTNNGTLNIGNVSNVAYYGIKNASAGIITNSATGIMNFNRIQYSPIYNQGQFNNNSSINIGASTTTQMSSGVENNGPSSVFNNNSGSSLIIEKCQTGISKGTTSTFTNIGTVSIAAKTTCAYGIYGNGILNNNAGGIINIDHASDYALYNLAGGTVTNAGTLNIKTGFYCINNSSTFTNSSTGIINVDGATNSGIFHDGGIFTNSGKITAGQNTTFPVGGLWVYNNVTFNNNAGAEINIVQASNWAITTGTNSTFNNNALINISSVSDFGLTNGGTFNNNATGEINIGGPTYNGFSNNGIALNNNGKITIGTIGGTFSNTGFANSANVINSACASLRVLAGMYYNVAAKTTTNAGLIEIKEQLFNAGTFTNNGVLKYGTKTGTGSFNNANNSSVILNNTPEPIFTYGGTYDGVVNGIFSNAAGTTSAGTFTAPNTFDPLSSLPVGTNALYAQITPQGGACTFVVPFTYVVTPKPEINVKGSNVSIVSGDISPSLTDSTDFGNMYAGTTNTNTFRIENTGGATLTLGANPNPVTVSGANASDFSIIQPSATSIASSGFLDFKITFNATTIGMKEATVSIANNDSNENPYTFKIRGTIQEPFVAGDFAGKVKIKDGTQAAGKVLTSDANGLASWQNPTSGLPTTPQAGDMIYYNGNNWVSIPAGQQGQNLTFCNGVPTWGPCPTPCNISGTNNPTTTVDYLPSSNAIIGNTFTACKTGMLTSISLQMDTNGVNGGNNNTGTHTVKFGTGAIPMTQTLANSLTTIGTISTVAGSGGTVTLTLANPVNVTAGTVYAFSITISGSGLFSIDRGNNDMTGGDYFENVNSVFNSYPMDLGFSVVIN